MNKKTWIVILIAAVCVMAVIVVWRLHQEDRPEKNENETADISLSEEDHEKTDTASREEENQPPVLADSEEEYREITLEEGQLMLDLVDDFRNVEDKNQESVKEYLSGIEWMRSVDETPDGGVSCRTSFGVTAVWTPESEDTISGGNKRRATEFCDDSAIHSEAGSLWLQANDILILCPYAGEDKHFYLDEYEELGKTIDRFTAYDINVTVLKDDQVSLEALKHLDDYDMIWFYSHGTLSRIYNSLRDFVRMNVHPFTMTGDFASSPELYRTFSADFYFERTVVNLDSGRIGVGGNFYRYYYDDHALDGRFFHFGSCCSMWSDALAKGILSRGASWVEGYTGSVWFDNDLEHFTQVIESLCSGKTAMESGIEAASYVKKHKLHWQDDARLKGLGEEYYVLYFGYRADQPDPAAG